MIGKRAASALLAILLILISGCGGASQAGETTTPIQTQPADTPQGPNNPWSVETITVDVNLNGYEGAEYIQAVEEATDYWESQNTGLDLQFRVDTRLSDADIVVDYRPSVVCNGDEAIYCTDTYDEAEEVIGTTEVEIAGGYTAETTRYIGQSALAQMLPINGHTSPDEYQGFTTYENMDPWPKPGPVVVGINQSAADRNMTPLVQEAVDYWDAQNSSVKNYSVEFSVQPNATEPDLIVRFEDNIAVCGSEISDDAVGCADTLGKDTRLDSPAEVRIETGYTRADTLETIKHEFGHIYGRIHGQEPMPLMAAASVVNRTAQPNATERAIPWESDTLQIYIDIGNFDYGSEDELNEQLSKTLPYFNDWRGTVPSGLTFERTDNRSEADIVVLSKPVEGDYVANRTVFGQSTDADEPLEYYTNATITIDPEVRKDEVGWYVGYYLDSFVNPDERSEPFDPSTRDRDDWWVSYS